jgi:hypothetical protein
MNTYSQQNFTDNTAKNIVSGYTDCYKTFYNSILPMQEANNNLNNCLQNINNLQKNCDTTCKNDYTNSNFQVISENVNTEYNKINKCIRKNQLRNCEKNIILPQIKNLATLYAKHTTDQNIIDFVNNNVTCEINYYNSILPLQEAQIQLNKCINNYTSCDSECKQKFYNMQNQYPDIQDAINTFNNPNSMQECTNI